MPTIHWLATAMLVLLVGCMKDLKDVEQERQLEAAGLAPHPLPSRNFDSTVIGVRRENDQVLAEIDVGTRDGVKEGWRGTIAHGGAFIATIRLIEVDVNRSVGVVVLEAKSRGLVEIGHRVFFAKHLRTDPYVERSEHQDHEAEHALRLCTGERAGPD